MDKTNSTAIFTELLHLGLQNILKILWILLDTPSSSINSALFLQTFFTDNEYWLMIAIFNLILFFGATLPTNLRERFSPPFSKTQFVKEKIRTYFNTC